MKRELYSMGEATQSFVQLQEMCVNKLKKFEDLITGKIQDQNFQYFSPIVKLIERKGDAIVFKVFNYTLLLKHAINPFTKTAQFFTFHMLINMKDLEAKELLKIEELTLNMDKNGYMTLKDSDKFLERFDEYYLKLIVDYFYNLINKPEPVEA